MGLNSKVSKQFMPTTTVSDPAKTAVPNVLNQLFKADAPNKKWVTDITYLPTAAGWVYLAVVLDLFSRTVVGWAITESFAHHWSVRLFVTPLSCGNLTRTTCFIAVIEARSTPATTTSRL